ncbi:glycosyltransferase family 4 protein [Winogradskyella sp. PG-2]|uniref:glycosyltransferase family 4 protein n=1 Tax=Winogradskyella sp. PG-2 TaxID=754409 RepID=UPI00045861D5|nr:glycosyltransferase family 1 protein [Winogradskyella sp. PG-2]BAO74407.1 putative glycosyl transferase [Winogradskyella sp. PG-2]
MGERKRIGLVFSYNENWIAGAYYILNIVHALNTINDKEKPEVTILSESENNFDIIVKETQYPYLNFIAFPLEKIKFSILERVINKLSFVILKKKLITKNNNIPQLDFTYPKQLYLISKKIKKVNWIPDFQEDYLPQFFSEEEILKRKRFQKNVIANGDFVVLSSHDAKSDFVRLYPSAKSKPFVLQFAVTHPDFLHENIEDLKLKYKLNKPYFFAPNQFWAHKNHIILLKAVKCLKDNGIDVLVAMSGKENDYRNKENFKKLKDYIKENLIEDNVVFLGFLPRTEQLCLFKNCIAVIQPSLFEGWSTVVEDAKRLNKFLILSNLEVHKEQVLENVMFFNPCSVSDLAHAIESVNKKLPLIKSPNYKSNVERFGKDFMKLVNLATI